MPDTPRWRRYLRFLRPNVGADISDELAFHFEQRVAEFMAAGAGRNEAEALARARFGDVTGTRQELLSIGERVGRRHERLQVLENLRQDAVYAARALRRAPGLAIACILTIALGVGANGAMFSLADRLFTRPPAGVQDPDGLRRLYARTTWSVGDVETIRSLFPYRVFALLDSNLSPRLRLAAYSGPDTMPMVVDNASITIHGAYVSGSYMSVLGIHPALGRFFAPDEQVMGSPVQVAVISDRLWRRVFGADSNVLGRSVEINHQRKTIVGVTPREFEGPDLSATDVWMPMPSHPGPADGGWYKSFFMGSDMRLIGRVAPGTPNDWISSAATMVVRRTYMDARAGRATTALRDSGAVVLAGSVHESLAPSIKPAPEVAIATRLVGVTIIVLLIACSNVASLLLARALSRRREIAVRIALGVSRSRLVAQLLCEGVVLAVAAGAAALVVSVWAGNALRTLIMPGTHWTGPVVDGRVVGFIGVIAIGTGLLAGLVPALQASRPELTDALKSGARDGGAGSRGSRLRRLLLVAQVAMSVLLLYGAGLFVHSLMRLHAIDMGFDAERVVYGAVVPLDATGAEDYEASRSPRITQGLMAVSSRLERAPGVERVALSTGGPMGSHAMIGAYLADGSAVPLVDKRDPVWYGATPGYFAVTGIRVTRGRVFTESDRGGPPVVVVNETAARTYWPGRDALGQCVRMFRATSACSTVIGVVRDSHVEKVVGSPILELITPVRYDSAGLPRGADYLMLRAKPGQTAAVTALVRRELQVAFPTRTLHFVKSVQDSEATELRPWRVGVLLFGGFGALALIIAALGTYSVLSYAVTQRLREIGVRMALGARSADVVRLVVGQGLRLAATGVVVGVAIALMGSRVLQSLLYDTSPLEPSVMLGVAVVLGVIAALASAVPARRASRVDPVEVMRAE